MLFRKRKRRISIHNKFKYKTYYNKTPVIKTPKFSLFRFLRNIFLISILGFILYFVFFSGYFKVKNIVISNNQKVASDEIEEKVKSILNKNLISNNILFIKTSEIKEEISQIPYIGETIVKRIFPQNLEIFVTERTPVIIWERNNRYYLVDRYGVVFAEILPNEDNLPLISEKNIKEEAVIAIGSKIISEKFAQFIIKLNDELFQKTNFKVKEIIIPETIYEIQVVTDKNISIYFDYRLDLQTQFKNINYALTDAQKSGKVIRRYIRVDVA